MYVILVLPGGDECNLGSVDVFMNPELEERTHSDGTMVFDFDPTADNFMSLMRDIVSEMEFGEYAEQEVQLTLKLQVEG